MKNVPSLVYGRTNYCNLLAYLFLKQKWSADRTPFTLLGRTAKSVGGCKRTCEHSMLCSTFLATGTVVSLSRHRTMQTKWCDAIFANVFLASHAWVRRITSATGITIRLHPGTCCQAYCDHRLVGGTVLELVWGNKGQFSYNSFLLCSIVYTWLTGLLK